MDSHAAQAHCSATLADDLHGRLGRLVACRLDELRPHPSYVPPFNPTAMSRLEGRPVVRSPEQLRLHRALEELGWTSVIEEFNDAVRPTNPSVTEPILITTNGTVLAGLARWRSALFDGRNEIHCIEYPLSEDESLQFIISHHQPRRGWNAFIRIRLALKLEPYFQKRALDNMRAGGKYKGSANLPEAQHVEVRDDIARVAGVGSRNVSNVKTILQTAHPRLTDALGRGTLSIHRALKWCGLPKKQQLEHFTQYIWERSRNKVIRQAIARPKTDNTSLDPRALLDTLRQLEARQPGLVAVRVSRLRRTVVFIGQDLLTDLHPPKDSAPV